MLAALTATASVGFSGCAGTSPRMRLVASNPTGATWSFVVEDRAHAAQLLIDGRARQDGCRRTGAMIRCELRGLFPGGHTIELRLAGGLLRRSALVGAPWARRPLFVRARDLSTVVGAAQAGADGVVLPAGLEPVALEELVEAAHKGGTRALLEGAPGPAEASVLLERYALDGVIGGVIGGTIEPATARRFPEARSYAVDVERSAALERRRNGAPLPLSALATTEPAPPLLEARGVLDLGLALLAERGAILDAAGFRLLAVRRRHRALREGRGTILFDDGLRFAARLAAGGDVLILIGNGGAEPWSPTLVLPPVPIDLLGGPMSPSGPTIPPGELAVILASPDPDRTRY